MKWSDLKKQAIFVISHQLETRDLAEMFGKNIYNKKTPLSTHNQEKQSLDPFKAVNFLGRQKSRNLPYIS